MEGGTSQVYVDENGVKVENSNVVNEYIAQLDREIFSSKRSRTVRKERLEEIVSKLNASQTNENSFLPPTSEEDDHVWKCSKCEKVFCTKQQIEIHLTKCHKSRLNRCDICNKAFKTRGYVDRHMEIHCRKKHYKCLKCEERFSRSSHLKRHLLTHSDGRKYRSPEYVCSVCGKCFHHKNLITEHVRVHNVTSSETASDSEKYLTSSDTVKQQRVIKQHECSHCKECFATEKSFKKHVLIHLNVDKNKYRCIYCKESFPDYKSLDEHNIIHVNKHQAGNKCLKCVFCEETFVDNIRLMKHLLQHVNKVERPYQCVFCDKSFIDGGTFVQHLILHIRKII